MKRPFEKNILGYITNLAVVFMIGFISVKQMPSSTNKLCLWVSIALIVIYLEMLTTIFRILKAQLKIKSKSLKKLLEKQKLLQLIIDNTTNPISVKKINREFDFKGLPFFEFEDYRTLENRFF